MKCQTVIDPGIEEKVIIYTHSRTPLTDSIEELILSSENTFFGYKGETGVLLNLEDVCCFMIDCGKVFAILKSEKLNMKCRLYQLEKKLPGNFIKINQSVIANIRMIERFDASVSGTLKVKFKNGHQDYVSRRNLKNVKERLGI